MSAKYLEPETRNRRLFPRYDFRVEISIKSIDPRITAWDTGVSQNLSEDGISLLHSRILLPNEPVYLTVPLFSSHERLILKGSVAWIGIDDLYEDSPYWVKAGIRFDEMGFEQKHALHTAISERIVALPAETRKSPYRIDFVM